MDCEAERQFKTCDNIIIIIRGLDGRPRCDEQVRAAVCKGSGGLSGPAGMDWPEPLAKWVLKPAAWWCCHAQGSPPTSQDGALGLLLISVVIRAEPRLPSRLASSLPSRLPLRTFPFYIQHRHSFLPSRSTLFDNPRIQHRGAGVCARVV